MADLKLQDLPDGTKVRVTIEGVVGHTYQDSPKFILSAGVTRGQYFIDEAVSAEVVRPPVPDLPVGSLIASRKNKSLRLVAPGGTYSMIRYEDGRAGELVTPVNEIDWLLAVWHEDEHYVVDV